MINLSVLGATLQSSTWGRCALKWNRQQRMVSQTTLLIFIVFQVIFPSD